MDNNISSVFSNYNDDNISLEFYNKYYEFVYLLKEKNAASSKLSELHALLEDVSNKYEELNKDEKVLLKNIIIIAKSITNNVKTYSKNIKEKLDLCTSLINEIENKQKEPIK